jgi:hypothetical protein
MLEAEKSVLALHFAKHIDGMPEIVINGGYFSVFLPDVSEILARCEISKVNGALGYVHGLEICERLRGKKLYRPLHAFKLALARELGYGTLIATVRDGNEAELRAAQRSGWAVMAQIPGKLNPWLWLIMTSTGLAPQGQED